MQSMQNYLSTETKVVLFKKTNDNRLFLVSPHSMNYWSFLTKEKNGLITFISEKNSITFHEDGDYYWMTLENYQIFKT